MRPDSWARTKIPTTHGNDVTDAPNPKHVGRSLWIENAGNSGDFKTGTGPRDLIPGIGETLCHLPCYQGTSRRKNRNESCRPTRSTRRPLGHDPGGVPARVRYARLDEPRG